MKNIIYSKRGYNIYKMKPGSYIVHNTKKNFEEGHTHINNYNAAKYVIDMSCNSIIPKKHLSKYLIVSIIRISADDNYITNLKKLLG